MGRKPVEKERADNPEVKGDWVPILASLFLRYGLTRYTMDELANQLGVSKATLYKYYASKDEILDDVISYKLRQIAEFEKILHNEDKPFEARYYEDIKQASLLLAEFSHQFMQETKQKYTDLWTKISSFQERALFAAERFYQRGISAGVLNDINPKLLALTDKIFIYASSNPYFLKEYGMSLQEAFDGFYLMRSKGIFKQKED